MIRCLEEHNRASKICFAFQQNGLVPFVITQQNKAHDVSLEVILECSTKQCSAVFLRIQKLRDFFLKAAHSSGIVPFDLE